LGNSIYLNKSSAWKMIDHNIKQISTDMMLPSGKPLGYRSVVCATLRHDKVEKPVRVLCTHLSGGRFEDKCMSGLLKLERTKQMEKCLDQKDDSADNVLVGDFNASVTRTNGLGGYLDVIRTDIQPRLSDSDYYSYMLAPFTALSKPGTNWNVLYKDLDGPTTAFGHVVDYVVTSPHMYVQTPFGESPKVERIKMVKSYMPWIKPTADEDLKDELEESITDHNGVKVTFFQPTNHIISAKITFSAVDDAKWSSSSEGDEWVGKVKVQMDKAEEPKDTSVDTYPIIQYDDSTNGPVLSEQESLVDLINTAQKPMWDNFLKDMTLSTFGTFMEHCAAEEKRVLIKYGWWVEENWYSIKKSEGSLHFDEKMTAAHKFLHGKVLSVRVLQALMKANMLKRE